MLESLQLRKGWVAWFPSPEIKEVRVLGFKRTTSKSSLSMKVLFPTGTSVTELGCGWMQEYWDWSWDDLVRSDLPTMLQTVHDQTNQPIYYVGYSQVLPKTPQNRIFECKYICESSFE